MTRMLASGAPSAMALARSRTMLALVLNKSTELSISAYAREKSSYTISSHARLPGNSSRDDHNVCILERVLEAIVSRFMTGDLDFGIDVTNVGSNTYQNFIKMGMNMVAFLRRPRAPLIS